MMFKARIADDERLFYSATVIPLAILSQHGPTQFFYLS